MLFNTATAANGTKIAIGAHAYKNSAFLDNDGVHDYYAQSGVYVADGNHYVNIDLLAQGAPLVYAESWNLEMGFLTTGLGYDFNPFAPSSTDFKITLVGATGAQLASTDITVNVPEPASLALVGLALAGLAAARRRRA